VFRINREISKRVTMHVLRKVLLPKDVLRKELGISERLEDGQYCVIELQSRDTSALTNCSLYDIYTGF